MDTVPEPLNDHYKQSTGTGIVLGFQYLGCILQGQREPWPWSEEDLGQVYSALGKWGLDACLLLPHKHGDSDSEMTHGEIPLSSYRVRSQGRSTGHQLGHSFTASLH